MNNESLYNQVLNELSVYIDRCDKIMNILRQKQSIGIAERDLVRELYVALKRDLKEASKRGTLLPKSQRNESSTEDSIYCSAVRHASIELRPKTNTDPIRACWVAAVSSCQRELTYFLERLQKNTN